ncbi:hypothetical protein MSAN_02065500 [Mycena sanguinolenta]|uniref:DUF6534 domain-containing protein n=1 Tax=Mycena sanguinolenta TaxID=230812 RepID=A0A8H6XHL8_9AGAR|nr:hypothetical protein MSAN_02065500 [Mycena sanguinolenta]
MAPVIIPGVDIAKLTGPMVLGFMWSYMLYGVLVVQIYLYTEMFPTDRKGLKILVWVMFFFETLFTVFMTSAAWSMFGSGWGDVNILLQLNWSWGLLPLVSGILSALAQGFYIWRIWHLTRKLWWPVPIALTVVAQYVGLWWFGIQWNIALWHVSVLPRLSPGVSVWLAGSAVTDVLITIALTITFWRRKKQTKFAQTTGILNGLIRLSIETGALTSITATGDAILWLGWERFNYHFAFFLVLGKLYSNVLMATLNCRNPTFLIGTQASVSSMSRGGDASVQTAFWSEPNELRQRLPVVNINPVGSRGAVQVSRNFYVESNPNAVMTNFNSSDTRVDDFGKGSYSGRL